jgi:hypothetical protein
MSREAVAPKRPWIVITSINPPTPAVAEFATFARSAGGGVVVVGDTKSPADWRHEGVVFLSIAEQRRLFGELADAIPTRSYARKNLGYLYAIAQGAGLIIDTDDDNRPYSDFARGLASTVSAPLVGGVDWVNVYRYFTDARIWPRGLPLDRVREQGTVRDRVERTCPVQQYLADLDPDVDAIYRLLEADPLRFRPGAEPVILDAGTFCPFNSQNTVFYPEAFELLYLPCFVSFRMTDIWRSFVAQRVLWEQGHHLAFGRATVFQERNAHDLMKDFEDEVVGYLQNRRIGEVLAATPVAALARADAVRSCYRSLRELGVVKEDELRVLSLWDAARRG